MVDDLLGRLRRGDRSALARLLTLVARGDHLDAIADGLADVPKAARVVAVTGGGGVGKSTLVGKLLPYPRRDGLAVAVLLCDPQSPVTGGALLGDRFRLGNPGDDGLFVRSVAAVGGAGAVALHLGLMVRLCEAFGFPLVLLETVGAGQGDVAVASLADAVLLLVQPEAGDDVQWEKAGILELADVVAVNKADLPGAANTAAQVTASLGLTGRCHTPVVSVSGRTGEGVEALWRTLAGLPLRRDSGANTDEVLRLAQELLARRWRDARRRNDPAVAALLADAGPDQVERLLRWLARPGDP